MWRVLGQQGRCQVVLVVPVCVEQPCVSGGDERWWGAAVEKLVAGGHGDAGGEDEWGAEGGARRTELVLEGHWRGEETGGFGLGEEHVDVWNESGG